ncbi:hypothetical protein HMSSN139_34830 [Paenibacillus sp. HMSSN-139]|nr:hypothetical protein HMSSN139_34830 [Paenibacillus sp. HMSSN-139]
MAVSVILPDGSVREYAEGSSLEDVAASISSGLRKNALAGKINGVAVDLNAKLVDGAKVEIITGDSQDGLEIMRHSSAHLMAQAVKRLFGNKEVKLGIGPVIEDGFYYDMDLEHPLNPEDLQKIEKEMERIIRRKPADYPPRSEPRGSGGDLYRTGRSVQAGAHSRFAGRQRHFDL